MNESYAVWMHPTLGLHTRNLFGVQLYKNNARALLSRILSIVNSDWLQHGRMLRGVYEWHILVLMLYQTQSGILVSKHNTI